MKSKSLIWMAAGVLLLCLCISGVSAAPGAAFSGTPTSGPFPLNVVFTDASTGSPNGWAWFFGDETYTEAWTQQTASSGWMRRQDHTSVAMPDGSIVLMGGSTATEMNDTWRSTNNGTSWTRVNASSGWGGRGQHTSVAMPDGSIVLMGGYDSDTFTLKNDTWRSTDNGATWTLRNASSGWGRRSDHTSVAMPDNSIVLMGGAVLGVGESNDTWRSTDNGATWTLRNASSGWGGRKYLSSVAMPDGSIVLMGGYEAGSGYVNDTWRSMDNGATWTQMTATAGWSERGYHTSAAMPDGSIVLMGGYDGIKKNDTWRSTDNGATWTQLPNAGWSARNGHSSVAMPDGSIVLMGGAQQGGSFLTNNETWRFDPTGSSVKNPSHTYTVPGDYQVALQARDASGYSSTWKSGYIWVDIAPPGWKFRADAHNTGVYDDGGIAPTNNVRWSYNAPWIPSGGAVGSSPAIANGVVYIGSEDYNVTAINATTGAKIWNFTTGGGVWSNPAVANGVVYVGSNEPNVYAINASTGTMIWNFPTGDGVSSGPAVANGVVYVGSEDKNVYAINANTGVKIWNFTTSSWVLSSPAVANGVVYIGGGDYNVYAINANTGVKIWNFTTGGRVLSSPAVANGVVYVGSYDQNVYAINATIGAKIWNFTTGGRVLSSPAVANGVVYVGSEDKNVYAINATIGAKIWNFTTGGEVARSSPAVANGVVYVGSRDYNVYAINANTGTKIWNFTTGGFVDSSPAVANGTVYFGSHDGNVYALGWSPAVFDAVKIVKDDVLAGNPDNKPVAASPNRIPAGYKLKLWGDQLDINLHRDCTVVQIDDGPRANGDHAVRYVAVEADGTYTTYDAMSTATNTEFIHATGNVTDPGGDPGSVGDPNSVNSPSPNPGGGLGALNLIPACTGPDCSHKWALLIDGGWNASQNHIRYWNDISFMYQTLNKTYGYPRDHIIVLMSDGQSSGLDRHNATKPDGTYLKDSSPLNLDNSTDNLIDVSALSATKANVNATLKSLNTTLTNQDDLFIFTTGHGGNDTAFYTGINSSIYYTWNQEYINDTEFVALLPRTPKNITMVMEQCNSGGFVDNFITNYQGSQNRTIATAATGSEPSWGNGFSNAWMAGVANVDIGASWVADTTNPKNGVSMAEAFTFAKNNDPAADSGLTNHEHPQYSAKQANAGATSYLSTCSGSSIIVTVPNEAYEVWHMGYKRNITWTQTGLSGKNVDIELWNGTGPSKALTIATVAASNQTYKWDIIPKTLKVGTDYKIKISNNTVPSVNDSSDSQFSIQSYGSPGNLKVYSVPVPNTTAPAQLGATIYIDGVKQAILTNTTKLYPVDPGSHIVRVTRNGYIEPGSQIATVPYNNGYLTLPCFELIPLGSNDPGDPNSLQNAGKIVVTSKLADSTPVSAKIFIGGSDTGFTTNMGEIGIDPGTTYEVSVKANGYVSEPEVQLVTVGSRDTVTVAFTLYPELVFTGFSQPIDMNDVLNTANAGRTLPVKWHLSDMNGIVSNPASFVNLTAIKVNCPGAVPTDEIEVSTLDDSGLKYLGNGDWHYNWKTPKSMAGTCQDIYVNFYHKQKSSVARFKFK